MSSRKYICSDCKKDFSVKSMPKCCPYCGGANIGTNKKKSEVHAAEIIAQMRELKTAVETAWQTYAIEYTQFEALRQKAVVYARRGIITEADIPVVKKTKLAEELRAYRGKSQPNPNPNYRPPMGRDRDLEAICSGKGLSESDLHDTSGCGIRTEKRGW